MTPINLTPYTDPDYGILLPTALVMPALGLTDHGLRKFRPLLVENVDFIRQPGPGSIERIFYSATGLFKLANAAATSQAEAFKTALQPYLPPPQGSSPSPPQPPRDPAAGIVPLPPHAVQPYTASPGDLDPYAPAQRRVSASTSITTRSIGHVDHTVIPPSITPAYAATESDNPAVQIAQQLAPHLAPAVAAQVAQQVLPQMNAALARLNDRPKALVEAELLFEQQRITLDQFKEMQQMILGAQAAGMDQAATMMDAAKPQTFFVQGSNGFEDLIALMRSEGMQMLIGLVAFAFALVALFGFLFSRSSDSVPLPDPTTTAPVAPIAPAPVAPVAPAPTVPPAPAAPANPVPRYYSPPTAPQ